MRESIDKLLKVCCNPSNTQWLSQLESSQWLNHCSAVLRVSNGRVMQVSKCGYTCVFACVCIRACVGGCVRVRACMRACVCGLAYFTIAGSSCLSVYGHLARLAFVYSVLLMHFPRTSVFNTDLQYWYAGSTLKYNLDVITLFCVLPFPLISV